MFVHILICLFALTAKAVAKEEIPPELSYDELVSPFIGYRFSMRGDLYTCFQQEMLGLGVFPRLTEDAVNVLENYLEPGEITEEITKIPPQITAALDLRYASYSEDLSKAIFHSIHHCTLEYRIPKPMSPEEIEFWRMTLLNPY